MAVCKQAITVLFHGHAMAIRAAQLAIVVHELAHLLHKNHTQAFWNEVDKVLPDYQKQVEWLKVNGAALDL